MTDKLNLDLSKAALDLVRLGIEHVGTPEYDAGITEIINGTPHGIYGLLAGLTDLSITLTESLAETMDEPVETILAMLEEDAETKWGEQ